MPPFASGYDLTTFTRRTGGLGGGRTTSDVLDVYLGSDYSPLSLAEPYHNDLASYPLFSLDFRADGYDGNEYLPGSVTFSDIRWIIADPLNIVASADTYVRSGAANTNEGASSFLRVRGSGENRALVRFDLGAIAALIGTRTVTSAILHIEIADNGDNWGTNGRTIDLHRLIVDWAEGNGRDADYARSESFRGDVPGATWNCAIDDNTSNGKPDCSGVSEWEMGKPKRPDLHPWVADPTASTLITNGLTGQVEWDVTADVQAFLAGSTPNYGWIVKKTDERQPGRIDFASRETDRGPRLVVTFDP